MFDFSPGEAALLITVWAGAFILVYTHADRHGSKHATAWGIAAFLATAIVVPIYFLRYWLRKRRSV